LFNCVERLSEEEERECANNELLQNLFVFEQFHNFKNLKENNKSSYKCDKNE
jgi:hypothetical protein